MAAPPEATTPHANLDSATTSSLLGEWAKSTLASGEWKDALVAAGSVSTSFRSGVFGGPDDLCFQFKTSKLIIYRAIYDRLETVGRVTDANECFRQMVDDLAEQVNMHDEQVQWILSEWSRIPYRCH